MTSKTDTALKEMRVKPEQASKVTKRVPTLLPFGKAFPHAPTQLGPSQVCRRAKPDDFPSAALVGAQPQRHSGQRSHRHARPGW